MAANLSLRVGCPGYGSCLFLIFFLLSYSCAGAADASSPRTDSPQVEQKIALDFKDAPLDSLAVALSKVLGITISVDPLVADLRISICQPAVPVKDAIAKICRKYRLRFVTENGKARIEPVDRPVAVLDFKDTPLLKVARLFSELTGKNVVVNSKTQDMPITMYLKNVPPMEALEAICKQNGLWYMEGPYYIRLVRLDDYARDLAFNYEGHVRIFRLEHTPASSVADTLATLMEERVEFVVPEAISSYGHVGMGADDTGSFDMEEEEGSGSIELLEGMETPEVGGLTAEQIGRLKEYARKRQAEEGQTEEEGEAQLEMEDVMALKKQIPRAYLTVFPRDNILLAYSADEALLDKLAELITAMDTPVRQVLLEGKILQINLGDDFQSVFDWDFHRTGREGTANAEADVPDYHLPGHGWYGESTLSGLDATSFIYNYVDRNFLLRLEMFRKENRLKTVGTPLVLAANNSLAEFFVGEERLILTDWSPRVVGTRSLGENIYEDIVRVMPTYSMEQIGTRFEILPFINEHSRVTLRLLMETQQVRSEAYSIQVPDTAGNPATFMIDAVVTSTLENILVAKDGQALAIGGLVNEEESVSEDKVPFLGDIPGLGFFFKKMGKTKTKTETILIIIPHIVAKADLGQEVTRGSIRELSDHPVARGDRRKILKYDADHKKLFSEDESTTNPAEYLLDGSVTEHYPTELKSPVAGKRKTRSPRKHVPGRSR